MPLLYPLEEIVKAMMLKPDILPRPLWIEQRIEALTSALKDEIASGDWRYDVIETWALDLVEHAHMQQCLKERGIEKAL